MSAKNKLMLIKYCNIIITWNLDPETPVLGSRNRNTSSQIKIMLYTDRGGGGGGGGG